MSAFQPSTDAPVVKAGRACPRIHSPLIADSRRERSRAAELQELEELLKGKHMHHNAVRYVTRTTAAAAGSLPPTAATSVAAAALAASIIFSPAADASSAWTASTRTWRGPSQLNQITEEQACRFEAKLAGRILGEA